MAKKKVLSLEEKLEEALIPKGEQPYEIPNNWEWVKLGEVSNVISGYNFKSTDFNSKNEIKCIKITNVGVNEFSEEKSKLLPKAFLEKYSNNLVKEKDVLLALTRPYIKDGLKTAICPSSYDSSLLNQRVACIKSKFNNLIYFYLNTKMILNYVKLNCNTTNQPNLSIKKVTEMPFPLPPKSEQERIVKKLDDMLSKTKQAKELISEALETFELRRASILHEAFTGKLTKKWREENPIESGRLSVDSLLEKITEEKMAKWEEESKKAVIEERKKPRKPKITPIEDMKVRLEEQPYALPNGWTWVKLENLVSILGDGLHGTPSYTENGEYFFVNGNNLNKKEILIKENTKRVSKEEYEKYKKPLNKRTVFVSINGTIGNTAFYDNEKIMLGKSACYFNLLPQINKDFIRSLIETNYFYNYTLKVCTGTTIKNLSLKSMRELLIPLPPKQEQEEIVKKIEVMLDAEEKVKELLDMESQIELLEKSILSKAFRGELGTNDTSDDPAMELLRRVLGEVK